MNHAPKICSVIVQFVLVVACLAFASSAQADSFGPFTTTSFSISSTTSDGSFVVPGTNQVTIDGPNGLGIGSEIDWYIFPAFSGQVAFDWSYSSEDAPAEDSGGYITNGSDHQLANATGAHGSQTVSFSANEKFGFYVNSVDGTGGPGILTVTDFHAVPEPGTVSLLLAAMLLVVGCHRWTTARKKIA